MRTATFVITALVLGGTALTSQTPSSAFELRPFAGASLPTGAHRDLFKPAPIAGLEVAYQLQPNLHIVGAFGMMREHTRYTVSRNDGSRYSYDAGVELSIERQLAGGWSMRPFAGLGAGGRTYTFQDQTLLRRTCAAGYGALGSEFRYGATALRFEARDNVFCYKSPTPDGASRTRNDVTLGLGVAYHFW